MKISINLSSARRKDSIFYKRMLYLLGGIFLLTVVVSFALIGYKLILQNSYNNLVAQENSLNQQFTKDVIAKKEKLQVTEKRLTEIRKILNTRAQITSQVSTLSSIVPLDSKLSSIGGDKTEIQMSVISSSLETLNSLIEQKALSLASNKKEKIQKIEMNSFSLNPKTLEYTVTFGVTFQ